MLTSLEKLGTPHNLIFWQEFQNSLAGYILGRWWQSEMVYSSLDSPWSQEWSKLGWFAILQWNTNIHTYTHTHTYIYLCVCVYIYLYRYSFDNYAKKVIFNFLKCLFKYAFFREGAEWCVYMFTIHFYLFPYKDLQRLIEKHAGDNYELLIRGLKVQLNCLSNGKF